MPKLKYMHTFRGVLKSCGAGQHPLGTLMCRHRGAQHWASKSNVTIPLRPAIAPQFAGQGTPLSMEKNPSTKYLCVKRLWPIKRRQRVVSPVRGIERKGHGRSSYRSAKTAHFPPGFLLRVNQTSVPWR